MTTPFQTSPQATANYLAPALQSGVFTFILDTRYQQAVPSPQSNT